MPQCSRAWNFSAAGSTNPVALPPHQLHELWQCLWPTVAGRGHELVEAGLGLPQPGAVQYTGSTLRSSSRSLAADDEPVLGTARLVPEPCY